MKKVFALAALITLALSLASFCRAEDYIEKYREYTESGKSVSVTEFLTGESGEEEDDTELGAFLDTLPEDVREMLPNTLTSGDPVDDADALDADFFIKLIFDVIRKTVGKLLPASSSLAALIVIAFILKAASGGTAASKTAHAVIHASLCVAAATSGIVSFSAVANFLKYLSAVSSSCVPVCLASLVATGRVTSAGVSATFISAVTDVCEKVFSGVVIPMIAASASLSFAESVFPDSAAPLSSLVRKVAVWVTVAVATVASFIFGVQSLLAGAADTAGLKTVKFAVGSFVPFVGGAVGDTVSVIAAGAQSVKNVTGVVILVVLFAILLAPLITLIAGKAALGVTSSLSSVLGLDRTSKMLGELSSVLSCLIAVVVAAACVFLVVIAAFISYGAVL